MRQTVYWDCASVYLLTVESGRVEEGGGEDPPESGRVEEGDGEDPPGKETRFYVDGCRDGRGFLPTWDPRLVRDK